jgi:hypothetical protein
MLTQRGTVDILKAMEEKKILLRLPQDLYERIETLAKLERRTVTAQIVYTLDRTIPKSDKEAAAGESPANA